MNNTDLPLISVIVVTYNSAKYIEEALDSIKDQTYGNIELIVTDDCSTDNTCLICEEWFKVNATRFTETKLVTASKNTGLPANCNRGVNAASGEWLKLIAGDDALFHDSLANAVNFINSFKYVEAFTSSVAYYKDELIEEKLVQIRDDSALNFYSLDSQNQYYSLLKNNCIHGGAVFLKKEVYNKVGLYIEKYRGLEDHPMWLKITKAGIRFYYMSSPTLKYRLHSHSIYSSVADSKLFNDFYLKKRHFEKEMILPNLPLLNRIDISYNHYIKVLLSNMNLNRKNYICSKIYTGLRVLSPLYISKKIKIVSKDQ